METNTGKKQDVYSIVTNRIIEQLEQGTVPWRMPWTSAGVPRNFITMRPYRGMNVWMLASLGYERNYFLSFKQVQDLGASVRKGEKGHMVVFWQKKEQAVEEGTEKPKVKYILRYYLVFNIAQCENIPKDKIHGNVGRACTIERCELIVEEMPLCPPIRYEKHEAFYNRAEDYVNMPRIETFKSSDEFYGTLYHELVHSTGHPSRLNRIELMESKGKSSEKYAIEELIAEIGACYIKSYVGLSDEYFKYNVAYIKNWLEGLHDDKRFIFYASSAAQRATDFILNVKNEHDSVNEEEQQVIPNN